jgi:hypothetical protein
MARAPMTSGATRPCDGSQDPYDLLSDRRDLPHSASSSFDCFGPRRSVVRDELATISDSNGNRNLSMGKAPKMPDINAVDRTGWLAVRTHREFCAQTSLASSREMW